jgi:hypothetical protein
MASTPSSRVSNPLVRNRHASPTLSSSRKEESFIGFATPGGGAASWWGEYIKIDPRDPAK